VSEETEAKQADVFVKAAFGAKNRNRLIDAYFSAQAQADVTSDKAWMHVYRLLLWADQSNGLAHCYESDKSQPGRNWYARSLAFHAWLSTAIGVSPSRLAEQIDWLFRKATADLAKEIMRSSKRISAAAERQRRPYEGRGFPKPGEDPELASIVREVLGEQLVGEPSPEKWQLLVQRIRQYLALENKRKNLVGEGFEDVVAHVVRRICVVPSLDVRTRSLLHELRGFNRVRQGEKANKVDVAVLLPGRRILVTAKWSVRADREKQFAADFGSYLVAQADNEPFEYVFVTNEFDPARLMRACEQLAANAPMFTHVVHICTDAIKATYGESQEPTTRRVLELIEKGRLISLQDWLEKLKGSPTT
jgi:hypothetical protein